MTRTWLVRVLVDTRGQATQEVTSSIRRRFACWPGASVVTDSYLLIHVTATTDLLTPDEAQGVGAYLETAVRIECRQAGCEQAVVRLTSVE